MQITKAEMKLVMDILLQQSVGAIDAWSCDQLSSLRSRIKKYRVSQQSQICCYCQKPVGTSHGRAWDLDHVLARSIYPNFMYEPQNLVASCIDCNEAKKNADVLKPPRNPIRYPKTATRFTICHPLFDDYSQHIKIILGIMYVPITAKGATTIAVCKLFRFYKTLGVYVDTDDVYENIVQRCSRSLTVEERRVVLLEVSIIVSKYFAKL